MFINSRLTNMDILKKIDFSPNPMVLVDDICRNKDFDVIFGIIHGSYVYKSRFLNAMYSETMHFYNRVYYKSVFYKKTQPPDVDVIIVVKDINTFVQKINNYILEKNLVDILNYFLTINVISENIFIKEIRTLSPTALKRILIFREILSFGNTEKIKNFTKLSEAFVTDLDNIVQEEYDNRKEYLSRNIKNHINQFQLMESEYVNLFPNYLKYILKLGVGGFPKERAKLVFPRPMELKFKMDEFLGIYKELL